MSSFSAYAIILGKIYVLHGAKHGYRCSVYANGNIG